MILGPPIHPPSHAITSIRFGVSGFEGIFPELIIPYALRTFIPDLERPLIFAGLKMDLSWSLRATASRTPPDFAKFLPLAVGIIVSSIPFNLDTSISFAMKSDSISRVVRT